MQGTWDAGWVIALRATVGGVVGSLVPGLWGRSGMSLAAIAVGALGGGAGVLLGARLCGASSALVIVAANGP
jgi:hypothetical protein